MRRRSTSTREAVRRRTSRIRTREEFTPSARVMVRKSVLSGVLDRREEMLEGGRRRRQGPPRPVLHRLARSRAAVRPAAHEARAARGLRRAEGVAERRIRARASMPSLSPSGIASMTDLMVMAVACDQTRVFNMAYSQRSPATTKHGYDKPHHTATHEEPIDKAAGYQPNASWFTRRSMEELGLLRRSLRQGEGRRRHVARQHADLRHRPIQSSARIHSIDGIPMFTAGRAGGRVKTGLHIDGGGTAARASATRP